MPVGEASGDAAGRLAGSLPHPLGPTATSAIGHPHGSRESCSLTPGPCTARHLSGWHGRPPRPATPLSSPARWAGGSPAPTQREPHATAPSSLFWASRGPVMRGGTAGEDRLATPLLSSSLGPTRGCRARPKGGGGIAAPRPRLPLSPFPWPGARSSGLRRPRAARVPPLLSSFPPFRPDVDKGPTGRDRRRRLQHPSCGLSPIPLSLSLSLSLLPPRGGSPLRVDADVVRGSSLYIHALCHVSAFHSCFMAYDSLILMLYGTC